MLLTTNELTINKIKTAKQHQIKSAIIFESKVKVYSIVAHFLTGLVEEKTSTKAGPEQDQSRTRAGPEQDQSRIRTLTKSISSAGTFFSQLHSQVQSIFNEA